MPFLVSAGWKVCFASQKKYEINEEEAIYRQRKTKTKWKKRLSKWSELCDMKVTSGVTATPGFDRKHENALSWRKTTTCGEVADWERELNETRTDTKGIDERRQCKTMHMTRDIEKRRTQKPKTTTTKCINANESNFVWTTRNMFRSWLSKTFLLFILIMATNRLFNGFRRLLRKIVGVGIANCTMCTHNTICLSNALCVSASLAHPLCLDAATKCNENNHRK